MVDYDCYSPVSQVMLTITQSLISSSSPSLKPKVSFKFRGTTKLQLLGTKGVGWVKALNALDPLCLCQCFIAEFSGWGSLLHFVLAPPSDTFVSSVLGKETTGHKSLLQFCNCHHVLMDRFVVGTLFNVHFIHVTHLWNWGPHLKHFQCDIFFEVLLLCSCHSP